MPPGRRRCGQGTGRPRPVRPRVLHLQCPPGRIPRACGTEPPHAGVLACPSGAHSPSSAFALRPRGLAPVRAAVTSLLYEDFVLRSSSRLGPEVFPGPRCHPVLSFPSAPCAVTAAFPPVPVVSSLPPDPVLSSTALGYPALIDSPSHHGPVS